MADLLANPVAILGFGFIGLALLMVYLAYRALKEVVDAPNPRENVIKLARLFMMISLGSLICAGPLQFGLLWAQSKFTKQPVTVKVALGTRLWQDASYGEVGLTLAGNYKPFTSVPIEGTVADGEVIRVELEQVMAAINKMQAQILAISLAKTASASPISIGPPPASDPANAALQGG